MKFRTLLLVVVGVVAGVAVGLWGSGELAGTALFADDSHVDEDEIVTAVTRTKEVSLLSLGIQGIAQKTESAEFFGHAIPGSDKAQFIQYTFNAKLGLDGQNVGLTQLDEHDYEVSVPAFTFIGYDDVTFELAAENNGALSWVTPDIDTVDMVNDILDEDDQATYVEANDEVLRQQASAFYSTLITSIDPEADVDFTFQ